MRPPLPPTVVGTIQSNGERLAGLERQAFSRAAADNFRASVSFVGKQGLGGGGGGGGEPVPINLYELYGELVGNGSIQGSTELFYLFINESSTNEEIANTFNIMADNEFVYGPGVQVYLNAIANPFTTIDDDEPSGFFGVTSAAYFTSKEFVPDQVWVDVDTAITSAVRLRMMVDEQEIFRFAVLPNTNFCLHRITERILVSPTRSLRIEGIDQYPATSGYLTIQVIGVSSVPFSQTVGLRFV